MIPNNRRVFMLQVVTAGATLAAAPAMAQSRKLEEAEPQAMALGYKDESRMVDAKRFPKHNPAQTCANCTIWIGKDANGGKCHVFGNRLLSGNGWCSQWVAK
jgi:High potential iron-sulfur protein